MAIRTIAYFAPARHRNISFTIAAFSHEAFSFILARYAHNRELDATGAGLLFQFAAEFLNGAKEKEKEKKTYVEDV